MALEQDTTQKEISRAQHAMHAEATLAEEALHAEAFGAAAADTTAHRHSTTAHTRWRILGGAGAADEHPDGRRPAVADSPRRSFRAPQQQGPYKCDTSKGMCPRKGCRRASCSDASRTLYIFKFNLFADAH